MTMKSVAELAGVSIKTVSRVLNGEGYVAEDTRRRVERAASRVGYVPNRAARTMRTGRTGLYGLLAHGLTTSPFAAELMRGIEAGIDAAGGALLIADSGMQGVGRAQRLLAGFQPDAVIFATAYHRDAAPLFAPGPERTVLVNCFLDGAGLPGFVPDDEGGGRAQAAHLVALGHRRVGMIELGRGMVARDKRRAGVLAVWAEAGLARTDLLMRDGQDGPPTARRLVAFEAAMALLDRPDRPTALICSKDQFAVQAMMAAARLGLRVPEDLSVIGYDDMRVISETTRPGLTSVALPYHEMGQRAAAVAIGRNVRPDPVPCPLVERGSTAPSPEGA